MMLLRSCSWSAMAEQLKHLLSANGRAFDPVDTLSDDELIAPAIQHHKTNPAGRRNEGKSSKNIADEQAIRAMLGNPKCHCRHHCLRQFTAPQAFEDLKVFRAQWAELHKLDQDSVVSLLQLFVTVHIFVGAASNKCVFLAWPLFLSRLLTASARRLACWKLKEKATVAAPGHHGSFWNALCAFQRGKDFMLWEPC